ncbi:TetR/AcrR family transcriptional regulator [soil metagenome]
MNGRSVSGISAPVKPREVKRDLRRNEILNAAEEIFAKHGFHEASMAEIARQSGFATGTIYLYFRDKADLYGSIILGKMREMLASLQAALESAGPAAECLRRGVHAQFAFHETNRRFFEIFLNQHQVGSSPLHSDHWNELETLKRGVLESITDCVARGQREGIIKRGEAKQYAVVFLGINLQMIRQWIREGRGDCLADQAEFAADCFLNGAARRVGKT